MHLSVASAGLAGLLCIVSSANATDTVTAEVEPTMDLDSEHAATADTSVYVDLTPSTNDAQSDAPDDGLSDAQDHTSTPDALVWSGTASIGALVASGTRDLDDKDRRTGLAGRLQFELKAAPWRALIEAAAGSDQLRYNDAPHLRQGYVELTRGLFQVRAGRQIIAWGRADRLNPTDNLSPRNLPALVTDIDEDRIGVDSLAFKLQLEERWSLGFTHIPEMRASVLPRSIADLPPQFGGHGLGGMRADTNTNALRLDFAGNSLDGSISLLHGAAINPAFFSGPALGARQPDIRVIGADFSTSLGERWGLRGEAADTRFDGTPPAGLGDFRYAVLGIERHFDGGWLGLAQFVHRRADQGQAIAPQQALAAALNRAVWFQTEKNSDALYFGLNRAPFEGDLSGDIGMLQTLDNHGRAWFANITYRLDDRWTLLGRWQHFSGPKLSNLGGLSKDSVVLLELRGTWGWRR